MRTITVTPDQAGELIWSDKGPKIFSVGFIKRTTGEFRQMTCKRGITHGINANEQGNKKFMPERKHLNCVWDINKKAFRHIPNEGILEIKMGGVRYEVEHND